MIGFWVGVLVAATAGAVGAGSVLAMCGSRRRGVMGQPVESPTEQPTGTPHTSQANTDQENTPESSTSHARTSDIEARSGSWMQEMQRCEQAVRRAARAVDSVSSSQARQRLQSVVRRMDAELPNVRALVELGRGLDSAAQRDEAAIGRVRSELDDAATRFAMVTDRIVDAVVELVAAPDLDRMRQQVEVLREQFPLLRPLSTLLAPVEKNSSPRPLVDAPA